GATVYWVVDARRVAEGVADVGVLPELGAETGVLGPGHYTLTDSEEALRSVEEPDVAFPVVVALRLRRVAVGLAVADPETTHDTDAEQLAAVLEDFDFLADPDGRLVKFHPRFLDSLEVVRGSFGTGARGWLAPPELLAELPEAMADWLMT